MRTDVFGAKRVTMFLLQQCARILPLFWEPVQRGEIRFAQPEPLENGMSRIQGVTGGNCERNLTQKSIKSCQRYGRVSSVSVSHVIKLTVHGFSFLAFSSLSVKVLSYSLS